MIGQTISHYRIIEELGGGGMGVVYKAEDTKLGRTVALKFLLPELTRDKDAKARFVQEAKAISALQHNNICTIHEIDETPDGRIFICLDHYDGETLKEKTARGPLPMEEALDVVIQVAEGLSEAHSQGILHRDIKPANILVTEKGVVKTLDFGLAKLAGMTKMTKAGMTLGTVAYMSPEQARGTEVDARSDVFSLGVVLYELLTGRTPFESDHEASMLYRIMNEEAEPVSKYRQDVPMSLQRIVEKALKKDVSERYESALDLRNDLEALGDELGLTSSWRRRAAGQPTWSFGRRSVIALGAVAVIVVAVLLTLLWRQRVGTLPVEDVSVAVVDFLDVGNPDDLASTAGITGLVQVGLVESSPCRVVSSAYLYDLRRRLFGSGRGPIEADQALEVARKSGAQMLLSGQMAVTGDDRYVTWQLMDTQDGKSLGGRRVEGKNPANLADQIIAGVLPLLASSCDAETPDQPPPVSTLTTESSEAYRHYVLGVLANEEARAGDAVRELSLAAELDSTFALALIELGRVQLHWLAAQDLAREATERAWNSRTRLGTKDRMRLEAWREQMNDRVGNALALYREMRTRWPDDREILRDLGDVLIWWWYFDEAAEVAKDAFAFYPDDYDFGAMYKDALLLLGRSEEAREVTRANIERHPQNPSAWDDLGWVWLTLGLPDSAAVAFGRALAIDPNYLFSQLGVGISHYCKGDVARAIRNHERILERGDLLPQERIRVLSENSWAPCLSLFYAEAGQFGKALEIFDEAGQQVSGLQSEIRLGTNRSSLLLRVGRASDVLRWAQDLETRTDAGYPRYVALRFKAKAWTALDSLETARSAVEEIRAMEPELGAGVRFRALKIMTEIALAEGKPERALELVGDMERHGAPPSGLYAIELIEARARAHRMAGQLDEAVRANQELLRKFGGHALAHYELGKIYREMNRFNDAKRAFTTFLEMWAGADDGLRQVEDARSRLNQLP
ncbi:MAG: protein kinase [Candidatus Latescibacterota bacterium]|nr:MAG: protein kinase [Candidatus Latescibacterota bacterium]